MSKMNSYEYKTSVPFVRWLFPGDSKDLKSTVKGTSFLPELPLVLTLFFTFNSWTQTTQNIGNIIVFILWAVIVFLLFTLALANAKTLLLPNALLKPLAAVVLAFKILLAVQTADFGILGGAVLGAIILGGVPYVLFQVSSGRWIGGGDVKFGFVAGLLLGWKLGLFCLGVLVALVLLAFLIEYITGKLSNTFIPPRIPTGVLWVTAIILSVIIGQGILA